MITAPNGYDDHEYSLKVSRAAPVGNEKTNAHFLRVDEDDDGEDVETRPTGEGVTGRAYRAPSRWRPKGLRTVR